MIVFFRAKTDFTASINRDFWRKIKRDKDPFLTIEAVGGSTHGHFKGSLSLDLEKPDPEAMAYEITAALVQKIELLSDVGVSHIEFEEITLGLQ